MEDHETANLEFCSQNDISTRATCKTIKEVAFNKNNTNVQNSTAKVNEAAAEGQMTEKQKKIAALKKSLLAPQPKKAAPQPGLERKSIAQSGASDMKNKFQRVMDWGTPRLVTKNR